MKVPEEVFLIFAQRCDKEGNDKGSRVGYPSINRLCSEIELYVCRDSKLLYMHIVVL